MKRTLLVLSAITALLFGLAAPVSAARQAPSVKGPPGGRTASIVLNQSDPHLGDWVTFTTTVPSTVNNPRVQITCLQNGVLTYAMADSAGAVFELGGGSSAWRTSGSAADCTAILFEWVNLKTAHAEQVVYAQTNFHAEGWR
jgi:hypothetical protein